MRKYQVTTRSLDHLKKLTINLRTMLRAGRALVFSKGYLPADGAQHRTVVELTHNLLAGNSTGS